MKEYKILLETGGINICNMKSSKLNNKSSSINGMENSLVQVNEMHGKKISKYLNSEHV